MAPLVYALTVNWNQARPTLACLDSLARLAWPNLRILVVDNGSSDGSPQQIAAQFPQVEQIVNPVNRGFAAGANLGLRHALDAHADFVLLINNDAWLAPDALAPLVEALKPPDTGAAAPVIYDADDPATVWSAGSGRHLLTLELSGNHGRHDALPTVTDREYLCACAILFKRTTLQQVGVFDERFFMYYEDSDYCLRMRRAGLRLVVVPQGRAWHRVGTSIGGPDSPQERYWMARSSLAFFRKHTRGWRWLVVCPYRAASAFKTSLRLAAAHRLDSALAYWRGLWDGLRR